MPHGRCIEQMVWDDVPNLLGRGGKVYLDDDTGSDGKVFIIKQDGSTLVNHSGALSISRKQVRTFEAEFIR